MGNAVAHLLINAQDILYVILIAKDKVVTLIRPRKHSIHPAGNQPSISII